MHFHYLLYSRAKNHKNISLFGMTPSYEVLKLFEAPNRARQVVTQNLRMWKKSETLWQKRSRQGKRYFMHVMSDLVKDGWTFLCSLDGLCKYSIVIMATSVDTRPAKALVHMMSLTIASPKKLQPDFSYSSTFYGMLTRGKSFILLHFVPGLQSL